MLMRGFDKMKIAVCCGALCRERASPLYLNIKAQNRLGVCDGSNLDLNDFSTWETKKRRSLQNAAQPAV